MSKNETWRTRYYWKKIGGLLIEEYILVDKSKGVSMRRLDGLIVHSNENNISNEKRLCIENLDVVAIQTKANKLGMSVIGQAIISKDILLSKNAKSVKSVVICSISDIYLERLCSKYDIDVIVVPDDLLDV